MDSVERERLLEILQAQEAHLICQEEFQTAMASHMGQLTSQIQGMVGQLTRPTSSAPPLAAVAAPTPTAPVVRSGFKLAPPAPFTGEQGLCKAFIIDCSIHFELTPHALPTDRAKTAFMISQLSRRAKAWASAIWAQNSLLCRSLAEFQAALKRISDPVTTDQEK